MTDLQFYSAAILAVGDRVGTRRAIEWERGIGGLDVAVRFVARERRYQADPDDVRMVVILIAENVMEVA